MKKLLLFGGKEQLSITDVEAFYAKMALVEGRSLELPRLGAVLNGRGIAAIMPDNYQDFYVLNDAGEPSAIFERNNESMVSVDGHTMTFREYEEQIGEKLVLGKNMFLKDDLISAEKNKTTIVQACMDRIKTLKDLREPGYTGDDIKKLLDKPDAANNDL